jgi:hypothetical protein
VFDILRTARMLLCMRTKVRMDERLLELLINRPRGGFLMHWRCQPGTQPLAGVPYDRTESPRRDYRRRRFEGETI